MNYDPQEVLRQIDANAPALLTLFGLTWLCQFVWWTLAARAGRRDGVHALPLAGVLIWIAHDIVYDVRFHDWFFVYDHWFPKAFWVGMMLTAVFEFYFLWTVWAYGRTEVLAGRTQTERGALLVLGAVGVGVIFAVAKSLTADPLFLYAPGLTLVMYSPLGTALLLQRRCARGQTVGMWLSYVAMVVVYWTACVVFLPDVYAFPGWIALGVVGALWGLLTAHWVHRAGAQIGDGPPARRAHADSSGRTR